MRALLFAIVAAAAALAQEAAPPPVEMNAAEKQFQDMLTNVTLSGFYTVAGSPELHEDRYVIERVTKVKEDTWKFDARIQYNKKDFKVAMPLPVKFAGDTGVISLTNFAVPGFGAFTARVLIYDGSYVGTWKSVGAPGGVSAYGGGGNTGASPAKPAAAMPHGGTMFGKIVKNEAPPPQQ